MIRNWLFHLLLSFFFFVLGPGFIPPKVQEQITFWKQ